MYFSSITSVNETLPSAGMPTAVRTASTCPTAPAESPVIYFASARMSWFSAHVTIGCRNVNTRRTPVLMTDGAHVAGAAGQPGGRIVELFWSAPTNWLFVLGSKYAARRGSLRVFRICTNTSPATISWRVDRNSAQMLASKS